ncbi:MAG: hypothetical protein CMP05_09430 [Xanthomarina sp.]|uniref:STAS/SEC14 domain-containing protein n=1 Tax=Xanthomarina TaxID=1868329 RepID=UPI000C39B775|nr:STAS/SEC14 domain-containing protein [Xanthomarina sp.]MAL23789.1 hypothetical protein [Xanthomarina sp.]MBF62205.1 hypothetical protein [Xanthomarina sp.]HAI19935.1 hypothetical protein [Xanthomarina gelatinilytica]|tara:strand:- start:527 stop:919 length:393 start_codon:yes stop_codon:yes gene_type:complete
MKIIQLSYGTIILLEENIAEVIINEGVVMDIAMIDHYHDVLKSNLKAPFSLLINKKFSYTYDFYAQRNLATLKEIVAMAVVAYNKMASMSTEVLEKLPRPTEWHLKIFSDREEALKWLQHEQEAHDNKKD